jgi:putative membrane protein
MIKRSMLIVSAVALLAACGQKVDKTVAPPQQPDAHPAATIPTPANEAKAPDFVEKAALSDMFEVQSSQIALKRTKNPQIKAFAKMMVEAHTKTTADLKTAIAASGQPITPPADLNDDLKGKLDDLNKADAKDFDSKYLDDQVDGHQKALDLMQRYANDGDVPQIKAFATATAPAVQMHLDKAKGLKDANKDMKKDDTAPPATPPTK